MGTIGENLPEFNPETGLIEAPKAPGETFSFFEDDEGMELYSGVVNLDGCEVRVRELTATELEQHEQRETQLAEKFAALQDVKPEEAEARVREIQAFQISIYDAVIQLAVSGWELKRPNGKIIPYSAASLDKLRVSKRALLCNKIVQRSQMGRDLTDFLGAS